MNRINKMLTNAELGDISQVLVSLQALQYNDDIVIEDIEKFNGLLKLATIRVAKAIQAIKFNGDYNKAIEYLESVGTTISMLLSYQPIIKGDKVNETKC